MWTKRRTALTDPIIVHMISAAFSPHPKIVVIYYIVRSIPLSGGRIMSKCIRCSWQSTLFPHEVISFLISPDFDVYGNSQQLNSPFLEDAIQHDLVLQYQIWLRSHVLWNYKSSYTVEAYSSSPTALPSYSIWATASTPFRLACIILAYCLFKFVGVNSPFRNNLSTKFPHR